MLDELKKNLTEAGDKKETQVIILSANGPVFSAGHNLKELVMFVPNINQLILPYSFTVSLFFFQVCLPIVA